MTALALENGFSAAIAFRDVRLGFFAGRSRRSDEAASHGAASARQSARTVEIIREPRRVQQIEPDGRTIEVRSAHADALPRAYSPSALRAGAAVARYEIELGRVLDLVA